MTSIMLYIDTLNGHLDESKEALQSLFQKVKKNQSDENDLLLVLLNGFHSEGLVGSGLSPFMFGPGIESYVEQTQYNFFHSFRTAYLQESKAEYLKGKQLNDKDFRGESNSNNKGKNHWLSADTAALLHYRRSNHTPTTAPNAAPRYTT